MKINQIYYTRLDEGWGIANATEGIDEKSKSAFQSINAQNPTDKTILSFDVFDGGYALSRSVPPGQTNSAEISFLCTAICFPSWIAKKYLKIITGC